MYDMITHYDYIVNFASVGVLRYNYKRKHY